MEAAALGTARLPLCRIIAEQAEDALRYLERISGGQVFSKENGTFKVYQACFSTRPRSHVVQNHFKPILQALREELKKTDVAILNGMQAVDLLMTDGQVGGVYAIDSVGAPVLIRAKSVILATGGASRLFRRNMYPWDITGDGYAMAYRAGACMSNMEFIQAGVGLAAPFINLFGNYLWEALPQLKNAAGEPFLGRYLPPGMSAEQAVLAKTHFPFSTRDASRYIEIAIQSECNQGRGTPEGNVLLNFRNTDFPALFRKNPIFSSMWEVTYRWHREKGIDLYHDPVEIACFAHAVNGGVLIDEEAGTTIPGLYAAGETASGPHGADRLGGNMSVTCQVFGKIAGQSAAAFARGKKFYLQTSLSEAAIGDRLHALGEGKRHSCADLLDTLQRQSDQSLLITRRDQGLRNYLSCLEQLRQEIQLGGTWACLGSLLQLENLVETGTLIARAALERRESRGSHYREDYPEINLEMARPIYLNRYKKI